MVSTEYVVATPFADTLKGLSGAENALGESFAPGLGNDTVDGRSGVDSVVFRALRADYVVSQTMPASHVITASHKNGGSDGVDELFSIEHPIFSDKMLAFGERALDVERVAFVLWTPGIAHSRDLFAKGIGFYDNGYGFDFLCEIALNHHSETGRELAQKLLAGTPGTSMSVGDIEAAMLAAGGGSTLSGRVAEVTLMALDVVTLANIDLEQAHAAVDGR